MVFSALQRPFRGQRAPSGLVCAENQPTIRLFLWRIVTNLGKRVNP